MSSERTDPFRDLAFNGSPAEYRAFRRKILLSVASLEPKSLRYAGPKILTRLVGEAWRATEHLAISEVRGDDGWLVVLKALDQHYKFLPETELNECVDEFLFHLRRRPNEGATAFTSRFRATLSRLETLIAADKASKKRKRKKKDAPTSSSTSSQSSAPSKASSFSSMQGDVRETASASAGVEKKEKEERRKDKKGSPAPSFTSPAGSRHKRPGSPGSEVSRKSKDSGYGSHKAEEDKAQRVMMRQLGRLEAGHLKLRPVFPSVVLGHLYMKKYGLTREQRTLVVRATGGSSRFEDVERIMRASDFEDRRGEASRAQRPIRKEGVLEADLESPSMSEPLVGSSGDEAFEADFDTEDDEATAAMQDAFEMQKQAKANVKKHFRTYKESRKKIREIKKSRQPYMPVVAIPPEDAGLGSAAATQGTMQPTFKYDRKQRTRQEPQRGGRARKEEVHMLNTVTMTEFSYMITEEAFENSGDSDLQEEPTSGPRLEVDVYLASVPQGYAVIDTGCTSSVIGAETAKRLSQFLMDRGIQGPESLTLPPVQLRGFNGARTTSSQGLKWLVQLGNLWGTVTTYVIPGEAPFLLSRKVLEGMEASLDLGAMTITSQKHGIAKWPLQQAANGHLLMPLVLDKPELEVAKLDEDAVSEPQVPEGQIPDTLSPNLRTNSQGNKQSVKKKQWFQTIMKRIVQPVSDGKRMKQMAETLSAECVREDCPESRDLEALYEDVDWVQLQDASTESHSRALIARQVDSVCRVPFQLALSALREEPDRVKEELRDWLGDQFQVVQGGSQVDLIEVFAGKAPLSACSERLREGASVRIGLQYGQACKHILVGPAYEANFHMCALGLRHPVSQLPLRKPTRVLTTDCLLASRLSQCMCPGHQEHACLEGQYKGKSLSAWAETYTESFCKAVCQSFARRDPEVHVIEDVFVESEAEADSEREDEADAPRERPVAGAANYKAMVQKLHVNTGHASVPQMLRLAKRACAPPAVVEAVRQFRCHVCQELQVPPSHRVAALQHTESPNHIVGLDVVQVELKRDSHEGVQEEKFNVLTAVDYATDFAQQIVLPNRPHSISQAFHSLWCRPYGPPKVVYVDPDQRWLSDEFQRFLEQHGITLLSCATESHWQLGRVEIAQRILRNMAQRTWRSTHRPATEVIETCASVRNEQLRKHGFSSSQWFLGREPRVPGALSDLHERNNLATQDAVLSQTDFAQKMHCRQQAAHAFIEAHAHETWTRAIRGRNRPMRGPYVVGQSVYVFRRAGRGLLSTRHGVWKGPGKVVGTESFREDSPVPRVIWVVVNGMMYKCSPETLRPVLEDELAFRELARQYEFGRVPPELDETQPVYGGPAGRYFDLTQAPPEPADFNLQSDAAPLAAPDLAHDPEPPATRRRVTRDSAYWQGRADDEGEHKSRRVEPVPESPSTPNYEPTDDESHLPAPPSAGHLEGDSVEGGVGVRVGPEELPQASVPEETMVCEVSFDIQPEDIRDDIFCLWSALAECAEDLMGLESDDLLRLEKAAYGLAEAPRAWFLRLTRELRQAGLEASSPEMDQCLAELRKRLPFGEFRTRTVKYTGAEIRQGDSFEIELSQESYIDKMPFAQVPGKGSDPVEPRVMRGCCGQLSWVASHSRPDQAFLASYLQGVQDRANCSHLLLYNKALREMKERKCTLKFPSIPTSDWRLLVVTDAGWGTRESGESQGGFILCLCESKVLKQQEGVCWVIEWASKKLRRVVRSSTAAETLAAQNGLDAIEFAQALLQECLCAMTPKHFRQWLPELPSALVIDSKSLYDALTRSACSTALAIEKRLAIDYSIARTCLQERHVLPFWTNNRQMVADSLTKIKGDKGTLYKLLDTCRYHVRPSKISGRRERAAEVAQKSV
ncbi:GIP [Symbiodinium natans]|uniref:GIP protein n=1 Tax=Symbiodinium natans TaxID=878477 RepID=A0A812IBF7_9DINO|nr:GIP [Symbiodinium natans]